MFLTLYMSREYFHCKKIGGVPMFTLDISVMLAHNTFAVQHPQSFLTAAPFVGGVNPEPPGNPKGEKKLADLITQKINELKKELKDAKDDKSKLVLKERLKDYEDALSILKKYKGNKNLLFKAFLEKLEDIRKVQRKHRATIQELKKGVGNEKQIEEVRKKVGEAVSRSFAFQDLFRELPKIYPDLGLRKDFPQLYKTYEISPK